MNRLQYQQITLYKLVRWQDTLFALLILVFPPVAFGQLERSRIGEYIASIPDPNSDVAIVGLLSNKSVAKEMKISDQAIKELDELKRSSGGSLSAPRGSISGEITFEEIEQLKAAAFAKIVSNNIRVREILDPSQIARLRQLVHQIEIARCGLEEALSFGHLGRVLGIEDFQKPALRIRAESIEKKASRDLMETLSVAMAELSVDLTIEQLSDVKKLLGSGFIFRDVQSGKRDGKIPDPESMLETVLFLKEDSIADELKVQNDDRAEILKLVNEPRVGLNSQLIQKLGRRPTEKELADLQTTIAKDDTTRIESLLDPIQRDRLKEIVYRFEIEKIGFGEALAAGFLGKRVNLSTDQITKLRARSEAIQRKTDNAVTEIIALSHAELIKELQPRQRIEAEKVLGKPFVFIE